MSNCALTVYGAIGSTLPLLEIDDVIFCRTGMVAAIFATGCRPLILMSVNAITAATASSRRVRFRRLLSINSVNRSMTDQKSARATYRSTANLILADAPWFVIGLLAEVLRRSLC